MILRIDDIVSGMKKQDKTGPKQAANEPEETFGDARDG